MEGRGAPGNAGAYGPHPHQGGVAPGQPQGWVNAYHSEGAEVADNFALFDCCVFEEWDDGNLAETGSTFEEVDVEFSSVKTNSSAANQPVAVNNSETALSPAFYTTTSDTTHEKEKEKISKHRAYLPVSWFTFFFGLVLLLLHAVTSNFALILTSVLRPKTRRLATWLVVLCLCIPSTTGQMPMVCKTQKSIARFEIPQTATCILPNVTDSNPLN